MFHSRRRNNCISKIHERTLLIIYQDYKTSSTDLIAKDNSLTIHHRNLQKLVTEMFKVKVGIEPEILKDIFKIEEKPYNLRHKFLVKSNNATSVNYGTYTAWCIKLCSGILLVRVRIIRKLAYWFTKKIGYLDSAWCRFFLKCVSE